MHKENKMKNYYIWCEKKNHLIINIGFQFSSYDTREEIVPRLKTYVFTSQSLCSRSNCTKSLETLPSEPKTHFPT